ncbi:unnamed protein product, partial [Symbiodinium pilosum]
FVPQQLELQIADGGLAGHEPASPDHNPKKHAEGVLHDVHQMYLQKYGAASEAGLCHLEQQLRKRATSESEESLENLLTEVKEQRVTAPRCATFVNFLLLCKDLYQQKYGFPVDQAQEDLQDVGAHTPLEDSDYCRNILQQFMSLSSLDKENATDRDGLVWNVIHGTGAPKDCRVARLEQKLAQVKQLYELKYGADVESDDEDVQFDQDGTPWIETRGTGSPQDMRLERLEQMLADVKGLYAAKYGRDVDIEHDADGTPWTVTEGTGVPRDCRQLYELKYGAEIESDDEDVQFDQDGTPWIETRGTGSPRDMRLERLEQMLGDVKGLYAAKYGRDVDIEHDSGLHNVEGDFMYDADGTLWIRSITTGGQILC